MKKSSYEGLQEKVRKLKTPALEAWENKYPERDYTVNMEFGEFTCICPKTGLPDFAAIRIRYIPDAWCVELKSLKMYFISFRNVGVFHEHLVNKILDDFVKYTKPRFCHIEAEFGIRGGIKTVVTAEYQKKDIKL
ncbi:MAG: NADPH-dependent 7-cyano-7-deazaguanine reductase QueF [Candidatus Omnitrophica bacterium]|nr:NADPH-dependent 7-cyano-7-deazaguanine reductase QueF [Candidatus Omnitrophota bacterium]